MIAIPFPFIIAEFVIFWLAVQEWGFLNTLGLYLLPCLLGFFILSVVGRMTLMSLQASLGSGQLPGGKMLHSGAIFLSGILFLIPSFFSRVLGLILLLPGLRHVAVWWFKGFIAKRMSQGAATGFKFGQGGPFGFGGTSGFRYYEFRNDGNGFQDVSEVREEREIRDAEVLDVTPLEVTHEEKKPKDN